MSATQPGSNNDGPRQKGKVDELELKTPNVLHFPDAIGSTGATPAKAANFWTWTRLLTQYGAAALVQSPAQTAEQAKAGSSSLLGTEASTGAPNSAGVKSATLRYDLPAPAVAVRNLVSHSGLNMHLQCVCCK